MAKQAKFTWFEKFSNVVETLPEQDQLWFVKKIFAYGMYGTDPEFEFPYTMVFAAIKEDIDNSNERRLNSSKGGSAPRNKANEDVPEEEPTPSATDDAENTSSDCGEPETTSSDSQVSESTSSESENAEALQPHTIPNQSIPVQSTPKRKGTKKFVPPTRDEVLAYKDEAGLDLVDVDIFMNHYESTGWKQNRGQPIKDWRAAMRNWQLREKKYQNNRKALPQGVSDLANKYGNVW